MKRWIHTVAIAATVCMSAGSALAQNGSASCAFSNAAYSGRCIEAAVIPEGSTAEQACQTILACLNDVKCTKTYCSATEIRGGWKLESATPAK